MMLSIHQNIAVKGLDLEGEGGWGGGIGETHTIFLG